MQTPSAAGSRADMAPEERPCIVHTTGKKDQKPRITYPKPCPCPDNSLARTSREATSAPLWCLGSDFVTGNISRLFPLLGDVFDIFLRETLLLILGGQGAKCDIFDEELAKDN